MTRYQIEDSLPVNPHTKKVKPKEPKKKLNITPREKKFCQEYIKDFNATRAAETAGYKEKSKGASIRHQAYSLTSKTHLRSYINELIEQQENQVSMNRIEILTRLAQIATGTIKDVFNDKGEVDISSLSEEAAILIKKIKQTVSYDRNGNPIETVTVELYDRIKALELLGKCSGMFHDKAGIGDQARPVVNVNVQLPRGGFR
jgi:phage terminase small subunit